jgi:hypothetical protein
MPAELFPLAVLLSGGRLGPEILIAIALNVGGTIACVAGLRLALKDVPDVPPSVTAWPWEPEAWGFPSRQPESAAAAVTPPQVVGAAAAAELEQAPAEAAAPPGRPKAE